VDLATHVAHHRAQVDRQLHQRLLQLADHTLAKSTEGFTRLWPSVVVIVCYETAFILLAVCVKRIAVGVVYALWSGVGVALVTAVAWLWLGQPLDAAGLLGVGLIVAGVVVLNGFSRTTAA
jgi:small multidrug resistance pump